MIKPTAYARTETVTGKHPLSSITPHMQEDGTYRHHDLSDALRQIWEEQTRSVDTKTEQRDSKTKIQPIDDGGCACGEYRVVSKPSNHVSDTEGE